MKKHPAPRTAGHPPREPESRTLPGEGRSFLVETAAPGIFAGLLAGALMALLYMSLSAAFGPGFWALPKMIAGMFWRDLPTAAMPWEAVLVGLAVHFTVAAHLGVLWALILPRSPSASFALFPLAIFFGLVAYVVLNYFVMELVSPPMRRELDRFFWVLAHLIFGATLASVAPLRTTRWVRRHRAREVAVAAARA